MNSTIIDYEWIMSSFISLTVRWIPTSLKKSTPSNILEKKLWWVFFIFWLLGLALRWILSASWFQMYKKSYFFVDFQSFPCMISTWRSLDVEFYCLQHFISFFPRRQIDDFFIVRFFRLSRSVYTQPRLTCVHISFNIFKIVSTCLTILKVGAFYT